MMRELGASLIQPPGFLAVSSSIRLLNLKLGGFTTADYGGCREKCSGSNLVSREWQIPGSSIL